MSQQTTRPDEPTTDESTGDYLARKTSTVADLIESLESGDVESMNDEEIVRLRSTLKDVESVAEEVRKDVVDEELKDRVEPGESLLGLNRVKSHRKYVDEDVGTVIMRAVSNGIDYTQFVDINASTLADVAPDIADIGRYEYTYFR